MPCWPLADQIMSASRSGTSSQTKHCVTDSDSVDADIHAVGSDAQRTGCNVVDILASARINSEIRAFVRRRRVDTSIDWPSCPARSPGNRDAGRRQRASENAVLGK